MKKYLIANWKENKTVPTALTWLTDFSRTVGKKAELSNVILCVSAPLLFPLREKINQLNLSLALGAQDVSRFEAGAYTGEVGAVQLEGLAGYVILGHSERRRLFKETTADVSLKVRCSLQSGLRPIICVGQTGELAPLVPDLNGTELVVYEPPEAISTKGIFHPETPDLVRVRAARLRKFLKPNVPVIYGGSVTPDNTADYLSLPEVSGVLVGASSLDSQIFASIFQIGQKYETAS